MLVAVGTSAWANTPGEAQDDRPETNGVGGPYRQLAPGVLRTIPIERDEDETFSRHDLPELLAVIPDFDQAKEVRFTHDIWNLEFSFKPVRFLWTDVPDESGKVERKLIWYLVYRIRNPGDAPVDFVPYFVLETRIKKDDPPRFYPDRLVPVAVPLVQRREDPRRRLLDTVEIAGPIEPSADDEAGSVWGVAMWTDIDPRTDYFSIYVNGLTNAYRWQDHEDGERTFTRKLLKLNFWRPGDEYDEDEKEIRVGVPGEVDYEWLWR